MKAIELSERTKVELSREECIRRTRLGCQFYIKQYRLSLFIIGIFWGAYFSPAQGEEILLKNGSIISGRVSRITSEVVVVTTTSGTLDIAKANIVKVQYIPFTSAQKVQLVEAQQKKNAAAVFERERIRQIQEVQERKRREDELSAKIQKEKQVEAQAVSDRAAALRELVRKGQMEKPGYEPISYWDFAWRSMVLPGWGHFYLERPWLGMLYSFGTVALLGTVVETNKQAFSAKRENHRDAELNFLLTVQPGLISPELRIAYGYYSNANAFTVYQHRVDQYNGALVTLATLYCVQIVHIIYNGFAWENGLLIVENQGQEAGTIKGHFIVVPEYREIEGKTGVSFQSGLTVLF